MSNDLIVSADKLASEIKRSFSSVPFDDLKDEAVEYLLEDNDNDPALVYVNSRWRLFNYALTFSYNLSQCNGDEWLWMDNQSYSVSGISEQSVIDVLIDAHRDLSPDGVYAIERVLSGELLRKRRTDEYDVLSMKLVEDNLQELEGWSFYRSRKVVAEIKYWWREYNAA